ncbi:unnamed protein product [Toxocara canis]|uniref:BACK domain-containing protein n=1 Tax=Toxocara canis TaxID=6265 RepID=A0A183V0N3_TOXCA|nr:unnamed protein product [Toxocara canis]
MSLLPTKKIPVVLDLTHYDVTAVSALCDYMLSEGRISPRITTSILEDIIELSHILQMNTILRKSEQFLLQSAEQSPPFLVHALKMLSDDRELLESDIGRRIIDIAVRDYRLIFKTQSFNDIPADIVIRIFDRCDLPVESEFELAQSAIAWVAARPERVRNAYRVFSCIRITNLTAEQHNDMINLINLMPYFTAAVSQLQC